MTTDEALEELRLLRKTCIETITTVPALVPNEDRWDVLDMVKFAENYATSRCDSGAEDYRRAIIATGPTPAAAIEAAKKKLEER